MDKKNKVEVLALLEAYRMITEAKKEKNADHAIRVCQAIIAKVFGYYSRADWSDDIQAAGLICYEYDVDKNEQYKILTEIVNKILPKYTKPKEQHMNRCYTNAELSRLVSDSLDVQANLHPYYCKENIVCWPIIKRSKAAVEKYNITPEVYWHGDSCEFTSLMVLLSDGYPSPEELLELAKSKTSGEIKNIAKHFYQNVCVMFDFIKQHHGYVVLSPSSYMQNLYPNSKNKLYVYTSNIWSHKENSNIDKPVLVFPTDELESLPELLKKKLGFFV